MFIIEILTLVKTTDEKGMVNFSASGSMPLDTAAQALVILASRMERPNAPGPDKKEGIISDPEIPESGQ